MKQPQLELLHDRNSSLKAPINVSRQGSFISYMLNPRRSNIYFYNKCKNKWKKINGRLKLITKFTEQIITLLVQYNTEYAESQSSTLQFMKWGRLSSTWTNSRWGRLLFMTCPRKFQICIKLVPIVCLWPKVDGTQDRWSRQSSHIRHGCLAFGVITICKWQPDECSHNGKQLLYVFTIMS